jgi:HEPN domain-containing protein
LDAARAEAQARRLRVAFESARHAAELACKALLVHRVGHSPKTHLVAGDLAKAGLLPTGLSGRELHRLLAEFTLGTYGFDRELTTEDVDEAIRIASAVVQGAAATLR